MNQYKNKYIIVSLFYINRMYFYFHKKIDFIDLFLYFISLLFKKYYFKIIRISWY